ncbi:YraN family protein [Shimwellia pseudoproteus]|uniref:YraN family protein n=1 Tax=Shimwellia pseudoproteus TaxID=570012 RepID=UPI0018EDFC42|nr:YraN family protein [Shimwellia pseudoproteus]MBJ3815332.1 YraN family protein [Shimwellia pseudoproteus]
MAPLPEWADSLRPVNRRQQGSDYELRARRWLERQGLVFIAANVTSRYGEIDLIMHQATTLVFIEVRYRKSGAFGGAAASVTPRKQLKIRQTASWWLARQNGSFDTVDCRFDVVAFTGDNIEWLTNAFSSE